jgi:hypothetical protein
VLIIDFVYKTTIIVKVWESEEHGPILHNLNYGQCETMYSNRRDDAHRSAKRCGVGFFSSLSHEKGNHFWDANLAGDRRSAYVLKINAETPR